jgi:hypothetical protein
LSKEGLVNAATAIVRGSNKKKGGRVNSLKSLTHGHLMNVQKLNSMQGEDDVTT